MRIKVARRVGECKKCNSPARRDVCRAVLCVRRGGSNRFRLRRVMDLGFDLSRGAMLSRVFVVSRHGRRVRPQASVFGLRSFRSR